MRMSEDLCLETYIPEVDSRGYLSCPSYKDEERALNETITGFPHNSTALFPLFIVHFSVYFFITICSIV